MQCRRRGEPTFLRLVATCLACGVAIFAGSAVCRSLTAQGNGYRVLVFSKTTGFRHASIPDGIATIKDLGVANNFSVDATEDSAAFNELNLAQYQAVVFLNTTGTVLDGDQKGAFERYIEAGGGFVGIQSAPTARST